MKLNRYIEISGKSKSTLTNYARCLSTMALHFNCCPMDLDEEQVLDYLYFLKSQSKTPSSSYFKHTVYGLRLAYKVMGISGKSVFLPSLKFPKKLPVVLSHNEIKGHTDIRTTLVYLHIAQMGRERVFCPLDKLYHTTR